MEPWKSSVFHLQPIISILDWPKSSFGFSRTLLRKTWTNFLANLVYKIKEAEFCWSSGEGKHLQKSFAEPLSLLPAYVCLPWPLLPSVSCLLNMFLKKHCYNYYSQTPMLFKLLLLLISLLKHNHIQITLLFCLGASVSPHAPFHSLWSPARCRSCLPFLLHLLPLSPFSWLFRPLAALQLGEHS